MQEWVILSQTIFIHKQKSLVLINGSIDLSDNAVSRWIIQFLYEREPRCSHFENYKLMVGMSHSVQFTQHADLFTCT